MSWFETIVETVSAHRELAYALLFLIALLESLPVLGLFVPGSTIIVGAAVLVPSGALSLWPLMVVATLGSMAGDTLSFWLGRRQGRALLQIGPLARRPELVAKAEEFFRHHGGKGVLLGRFTPPLRGILPAVAGIAGTSWTRFLAFDTLAVIGWGPAHVLPGALIGASLELAGAVTGRLGGLLLLLIVALYLLVVAIRMALRWGVPAAAEGLRRLLVWGRAHNTLAGREVVALLDPDHREAKALAVLAALLILGGWGFFAILENVIAGDLLARADAAIFHAFQEIRSPWGDAVMVAVTELGDAWATVPVAIAGLLWLTWRRAWIDAAYWTAAVVLAQAVATAVKVALHTPRPIPALYEGWSAFSFPSGHTTVNAALYAFLAVMVTRQARPATRNLVIGGIVLLVGWIALSRLYLGAHWFSDVAGGLGFGLAWVGMLGIAYVRHRPADDRIRGLLPITLATLVVAGTINIAWNHGTDLARYQPQQAVTGIAAADWLDSAWKALPSHRIDLGGEIEEPFVLQWAGTPAQLTEALADGEWRMPRDWNASGLLAWLISDSGAATLPVLPKLHDGRSPALMLIRPDEDRQSRLVLRLWNAHVKLDDDGGALWLATVTRERLHRPLGLMTLAITGMDANSPRDALADALPARPGERTDPPEGDSAWDGVLLLGGGPARSDATAP